MRAESIDRLEIITRLENKGVEHGFATELADIFKESEEQSFKKLATKNDIDLLKKDLAITKRDLILVLGSLIVTIGSIIIAKL